MEILALQLKQQNEKEELERQRKEDLSNFTQNITALKDQWLQSHTNHGYWLGNLTHEFAIHRNNTERDKFIWEGMYWDRVQQNYINIFIVIAIMLTFFLVVLFFIIRHLKRSRVVIVNSF